MRFVSNWQIVELQLRAAAPSHLLLPTTKLSTRHSCHNLPTKPTTRPTTRPITTTRLITTTTTTNTTRRLGPSADTLQDPQGSPSMLVPHCKESCISLNIKTNSQAGYLCYRCSSLQNKGNFHQSESLTAHQFDGCGGRPTSGHLTFSEE